MNKACGSSCSSDLKGVWASEWKISSVGSTLANLQDGLIGSFAVVEPSGIVLSTSSEVVLQPALTCSDMYISQAAAEVQTNIAVMNHDAL